MTALDAFRRSALTHARLPPATSRWRWLKWVLRGGSGRLHLARVRREAIFGDGCAAMAMYLGDYGAAKVFLQAIHIHANAVTRNACYRAVLCTHVAPGGRRRSDANVKALLTA
jgi:hypothetical protein